MPVYQVGSHVFQSESTFAAEVEAANRSTVADAQRELYTYLIHLAHLP
jgi:hypothetical protein